MKRIAIVAAAALLVAGASKPVIGVASKPGPALVVGWRAGASPLERTAAREAADALTLHHLGDIGVEVLRADRPAQSVAVLRRDPAVAFVQLDGDVHLAASRPNDPLFERQWNLHQANDADIDAPRGWAAVYGTDANGQTTFPMQPTGPVIGIIDTGVDRAHPDIGGKVISCASALGGQGVVLEGSCQDLHGHGTHAAGIAAATADNAVGVAGIAPGASVAACKALDDGAHGFVVDLLACLDWLSVMDVAVISMSLESEPGPALAAAVRKVWHQGRGTLMVAAAGNSGDVSPTYPAAYPTVVSVASTNKNDRRSYFSNYNRDVELSAPGSRITSTTSGGGYATFSGTSAATPHAAGVAAMIKLVRPGLSARKLRKALHRAVDDLGARGRDPLFGFGRLNLAKAVAGGRPSGQPL